VTAQMRRGEAGRSRVWNCFTTVLFCIVFKSKHHRTVKTVLVVMHTYLYVP